MNQALIADGDVSRTGVRQPVDVAVGILVDAQQRYLMTTRPHGKVYAGYWEFPGGKVEAGESVVEALRRELLEEIGVVIDLANTHEWRTLVVDYPHALVHLHFCQVTAWTGQIGMLEGQSFEWISLPTTLAPVLPGALPVLEWLATPA